MIINVAAFLFYLLYLLVFIPFIQSYYTGSCGRTLSFLSVQVQSCKVFDLSFYFLFSNLSFSDVDLAAHTHSMSCSRFLGHDEDKLSRTDSEQLISRYRLVWNRSTRCDSLLMTVF